MFSPIKGNLTTSKNGVQHIYTGLNHFGNSRDHILRIENNESRYDFEKFSHNF
jgi:hypothetical protein